MAAAKSNDQFRLISVLRQRVWRWLLPGTAAGFIIAQCVMFSHQRLLWADEILTWYPVTAPLGKMLASTWDSINAAPPLYFIFTWAWAHVFGSSALSLRLVSALALGAAVLIMFKVLRRVYGGLVAALAVTVAILVCDPALIPKVTEARFHTVIIAEVAVAILLYQRMMAARGKVPFGLLAANAGIHACIVMTHYFGPLYSAAVFSAVLLTAAIRRFNPFRTVISIMAGWAIFLLWIPAFLRHQAMGKPSFWIGVPNTFGLHLYYEHYFNSDFWLLAKCLLLFALVVGSIALASGGELRRLFSLILSLRPRELPLLMLIPGLGAVPLVVYFLSTRPGAIPFFLDRYMHTGALGWAVVCALFIHRAFVAGALVRPSRLRKFLSVARIILVTVAVCWSGWKFLRPVGEVEQYQEILVGDPYYEKIVVEHIHEYLAQNFYSTQPERYLFVVDEEVGITEGGGGPLNHRIMAGLKRNFPQQFPGVVSNEEFAYGTTNFWVKRGGGLQWWSLRIEHSPSYLCDAGDGELIHVRRIAPVPSGEAH